MEKSFKQYMTDHYDSDELLDIANHGCVTGCASTLIYYSDTNRIYDEYCDNIHELIAEYSESMGGLPSNIIENIGSAMQFKNAMVWLAAELVAYDATCAMMD